MIKTARNETMVGMFVVIGFIFLSLIIFFISGVYFFKQGYHINVIYKYVSILDKGAPIRMAGVRIGEVSKVELVFNKEIGETQVKVRIFLHKEVDIRENYKFYIRGTHILSEPHIEISPQPGDKPRIQPEATIRGEDPIAIEDLITTGHSIVKHLDEVVGVFHEAFADEKTAGSLKQLVGSLTQVTRSLETVLSGREEDLQSTIVNLKSSTESLEGILTRIDQGQGTLGSLIVKDELYQDMRDFVAEIKAHPWRLMKKDSGKKFLFF
ncbi:MAG: MlaD family protein [Candidatus Omnitrophota bacterium]|jgi:phospholipid/cholesterol/gamma-HCH transport system substrate-binding protein